MAVDKTKVRDAIKRKFPSVNLSTARLDEISARLSTKPADDADDAAIEAVVDDFNSIMAFSEIAANDDRIRTLSAKAKDDKPGDPPQQQQQQQNPAQPSADDERLARLLAQQLKPLQDELNALKGGYQGLTQAQKLDKLKAAAAAKNIPDFLLDNVQIGDDFNQDTAINNLSAKWTEIQAKHFNGTPSPRPHNPAGDAGKDKPLDPAVKRLQERAKAAQTAQNTHN